jgi:methylaspartate mutase sigma subunit
MKSAENSKGTLVTGVIGEDVHIIGIRVLEHALSAAGFRVVSLGINTSKREFVDAAVETKADAILVSSLSGHAKLTAEGLREACIEAGLKDILLYIGGMLTVDEPRWVETEKAFKEMGFNRVYPPAVIPRFVITDLEVDLEKRP